MEDTVLKFMGIKQEWYEVQVVNSGEFHDKYSW